MYQNPFTPGYEVLSKSGYSIDHGSISTTASYLITNDFPDYAAMFYSPTEHEVFTSIKYGSFEQGYDNLREIREFLNGPPIEFYIPDSGFIPDLGGGRHETQIVIQEDAEKLMDKIRKEALQEIKKAQKEVSARKIKSVEIEDILLLRKIKRTIVFDNK